MSENITSIPKILIIIVKKRYKECKYQTASDMLKKVFNK